MKKQGILWWVFGKKIEEKINENVSWRIEQEKKLLKNQEDELKNHVKRYEKLILKYGEVFKGLSSPNQYMLFVLNEHQKIRDYLMRTGMNIFGHRENDLVSYIDTIRLNKNDSYYTIYPNTTLVEDDDLFILGALDFGKKTTGDIKIIKRNTVHFVGHVSNERWLPLMDIRNLLLVEPEVSFIVECPVKPKLFVLRVEVKGKTIV